MAYFGKEYKFEKEEKFDEFIKAVASGDGAGAFLDFKPNYKMEKKGDEYVMTISEGSFKKEVAFKPGVPFDETMKNGLKCTSVFTVDGDTFTQVQDYGSKGKVTMKREFSPDQLKISLQSSNYDGVAYRYYVPV